MWWRGACLGLSVFLLHKACSDWRGGGLGNRSLQARCSGEVGLLCNALMRPSMQMS